MPGASTKTTAVDRSVLLVQLSDSHLFADGAGKLLGVDTQDSLQRVIERVLQEQQQIDLILASGDLSQDGSAESYQRFREMTAVIPAPARWFPGNHDEVPAMQAACVDSDLLEPVIDLGNWRVTLLDSSIPGAVPGYLSEQQLALLERALSEAPDRHHLICLHHHPVSIGCKWMEPIGLRNPDALFAVLERFSQVRAVLWGISIRSSISSAARFAYWRRPQPACSSPQAARSFRWINPHRAIAGCACLMTVAWKPVCRG